MQKKILGVLAIVILGGLVYLAVKSTTQVPKQTETQPPSEVGGGSKAEIKEEKKPEPIKKLLYRQNSTSEKSPHPGKQVVELKVIDLNGQNKKIIFTDLDEDFQVRLVDGLLKDSILVFGTPLNETAGAIWQIQTDGSGIKKQIIDNFTGSSFTSNGEKIAFVAYDNIQGVYTLWVMNMDGRFKTKILESETNLSDPVFWDKNLAFVKIDKEGNGSINTVNLDGSNQKEILKAKDEFISGLYFAANKFTYIKTPKTGGQENLAEVYICDSNGQNEKRITNDKEADGFPVISSDGSKIAFYKNGKIWVGNSDGSDTKVLVEGTQPIGFFE